MVPKEVDVLIIGAGPAGSTAAALLQKQGFKLLVVEKHNFPRFVIGESLLPHSMSLLQEAGLLDAVESQNFMQKNGAVFLRGGEVCSFDFANQSTPGFKYTYQVPRAEFDKALADAVAARGVQIEFGHGVVGVDFRHGKALVTLEDSGKNWHEVSARFVLDCSGYGRVLPCLLHLEAPSSFPVREALFTHVTDDLRPPGREEGKIWVCIHPDGAWIWIIPFSNGKTSVGVVAEPAFFKKFPGDSEAQLRAILMSDPNPAARLADVEFVFQPQRISGYSCGVTKLFGPQFALVGNATEFLDPIFSSGVALALESAKRASEVLGRHLRGEPADWQKDYADHVMHGINTFRAYVNAWYDTSLPKVFFSANRNPDIMRQICSVLAGYVWDPANPYAMQASRALGVLSHLVNRPAAV